MSDNLSRRTSPRGLTGAERALGALAIGIIIVAALLSGGPATPDFAGHTITVRSGDTLWSLAKQNRVPGLTTQETVEAILKANGMKRSSLAAGSTLRVPSDSEARTFASAATPVL